MCRESPGVGLRGQEGLREVGLSLGALSESPAPQVLAMPAVLGKKVRPGRTDEIVEIKENY